MSTPDIGFYKKNLNMFVSSLPKTNISFLYFVKDYGNESGFIPRVNTSACKWVEPNVSEPMYFIPGVRGDTFYHVYRESTMKYESILGGSVNWGDHLTIGLEKSFANGKIVLITDKKTYIANPDNPAEYQRDPIECNVFLTDVLNKSSQCIQRGKPDGSCLQVYETIGNDREAIVILQALHSIIWGGKHNPSLKGGKGPKGEKYMKGGNGAFKDPRTGGFNPSFVDFFERVVLDAIVAARPDLTEAILVDEGMQAEEGHILVRYIFGESSMCISHVFTVEHRLAYDAWQVYQKPILQRSVVDRQTMTRFIEIFRAALVRV